MAKIVGIGGNKPQKASEQPTQQPKIDLGKSNPVICSHCGYDVFIDGSKFRKISKLITGTPQDVVVPIEVLLCGNCGEICQELLSPQLAVLEELDKKKKEENE
jgi:hypothetical protein|tara:strand:+ start:821 stop:1129 length:309 start_codon:yes stop_codon:yes gene_type:complete